MSGGNVMNRFWKKLGLRKPDEMERFILFRAQRNAYLFQIGRAHV